MIEIYSGSYCPYCVRAKQLLQQLKIEYTEYDVQSNPEQRQEMMTRSQGARSIPQIFIHDIHVGGCDELYALHRQGKLTALLQQQEK
ncbi:MAG: glutaredoxin 3 [Mariprofundaceae bacterium]|nr:glutaredoxin 3 [Mariprofundaceae bacterium]